MRSTRGPSGADPSRADAAARRLALLAADLGAVDPDLSLESLPHRDDYTRVVPARRVAPVPPAAPVEASVEARVEASPAPEPPRLPRPGRHAARRRWVPATPDLPELGASQLTVVAVLVAAGIAFTAWWVVRDQATPAGPPAAEAPVSAEPLEPASTSPARADQTDDKVTVDVTGKVRRPGIVVLDLGARVVDALAAAGGERRGVDLTTLNLARVLVDGEQIVVGAKTAAPVVPPGVGTPAPGAPTALVNLNTASQAELETLPDVGPVTALAIIAWRDQNGGFTSVDELLAVDGIGETTLSNLAPYVTV